METKERDRWHWGDFGSKKKLIKDWAHDFLHIYQSKHRTNVHFLVAWSVSWFLFYCFHLFIHPFHTLLFQHTLTHTIWTVYVISRSSVLSWSIHQQVSLCKPSKSFYSSQQNCSHVWEFWIVHSIYFDLMVKILEIFQHIIPHLSYIINKESRKLFGNFLRYNYFLPQVSFEWFCSNEWKMSKLEAFTEVLTYVTWLEIMWHI